MVKRISKTDQASILIILICLLVIGLLLWKFTAISRVYYTVNVIGSVASVGGFIITIIQLLELRKTAEATQQAITTTETELSILRAIESATNCFNQMNQIDEYLETNNIDSIKTLLPIATKNFHELVFFKDFNLEEIMQEKASMGDFLESYASQLTIKTHHRNIHKKDFIMEDAELEQVSLHIQKIKAFANKYKTHLQQAIVKE